MENNKSETNNKSEMNEDLNRFKYLIDNEYEPMNWNRDFEYPGMVRIRVPTDGSCFFHAIAKSYFKPYIMGSLNGNPINRNDFIVKLRKDLANKLASKVNPLDPESPIYYDILSRGNLREISQSLPNYSLENMMHELNSNHPVDNVYNEFISNQLNKDIYLLDLVKQDVYMTGSDDEILYKNRPSIVILYIPGHYELVGIQDKDSIMTVFDPTHPFIQAIQNRKNNL